MKKIPPFIKPFFTPLLFATPFFTLFFATFFTAVALFFSACADKDTEKINADLRKQVLMYAQKLKFTQQGENNLSENAVLLLSYLNLVLEDEEKNDIFALAISPKGSDISTLKAFMDENEALIAPLEDELKKYLINTDYTDFYKLTFPFKDASVIAVRLCLAAECVELSFQKYSKSLYYRSADVDTQYN